MIWPSRHTSLGQLLADAFVQHQTETACVYMHRKEIGWTGQYRDVAARVRGARDHLDVQIGERVAILGSNQPDWLIAAAAVLQSGGVLVPLDFKLGPDEQAALLDHSGATRLVAEPAVAKRLGHVSVPVTALGSWPEDGSRRPAVHRSREDLATIVYSSGTGGRPKGCMLSHGAYLSQLEGLLARFPLERGDRYFSILPSNHAIDFLCGFVGAFACGATVVHQRTLRPEFLLDTMRQQQITHMAVVPLVLKAFERAIRDRVAGLPGWQQAAFHALTEVNATLTAKKPAPWLSRQILPQVHAALGGHLELMFCGGAPVDADVAEFFYRIGIPVAIGYGLTEACTVVTVNDLAPFRADTVGNLVDGVEIRIADPDASGIGEVQVRGPTLMTGYLDDPELTAETFTEDGYLKTGDLGWLDASFHLHLVGRSKNMVVTPGGKNVYPEDVEGAFANLPCDELVVVTDRWVWPGGELGDDKLVAVIRSEVDVTPALQSLNRRLPAHKRLGGWLPWSEAFPRTATMKVKRAALAEQLRATLNHADVRSL